MDAISSIENQLDKPVVLMLDLLLSCSINYCINSTYIHTYIHSMMVENNNISM